MPQGSTLMNLAMIVKDVQSHFYISMMMKTASKILLANPTGEQSTVLLMKSALLAILRAIVVFICHRGFI